MVSWNSARKHWTYGKVGYFDLHTNEYGAGVNGNTIPYILHQWPNDYRGPNMRNSATKEGWVEIGNQGHLPDGLQDVEFLSDRSACVTIKKKTDPIRMVYGNNVTARKRAQTLVDLQLEQPQGPAAPAPAPSPPPRTSGPTTPMPWWTGRVRPQGQQWFNRSDRQACGLLDSQPSCVGGDTLVRPSERIGNNGRWSTKQEQPDACTRVNLQKLCFWILSELSNDELLQNAHTIIVITDSRELRLYWHWKLTGQLYSERRQWVGPFEEKTEIIFVPLDDSTGLGQVQYFWGIAYVLEALRALWPHKHLQAWDNDAAPTTLFETAQLEHMALPHEMGWGTDPEDKRQPRNGAIFISELYHLYNAGIAFFPTDCPERPIPEELVTKQLFHAVLPRATETHTAKEREYMKDNSPRSMQVNKARASEMKEHMLLLRRITMTSRRDSIPEDPLEHARLEEAGARFWGTPFENVEARCPGDFIRLWALLGNLAHHMFWPLPESGTWNRNANPAWIDKYSS
jgi:hypothetical protein